MADTIMAFWKIYRTDLMGRFIAWDGEFIEADSREKAIVKKNSEYHYNDIRPFYDAIPFYWELPFRIKYNQKELF